MSRCLSKCFYVEYAQTYTYIHTFQISTTFCNNYNFRAKNVCSLKCSICNKLFVHVWISMSGRLSYVYFVRIKITNMWSNIKQIKTSFSLSFKIVLYEDCYHARQNKLKIVYFMTVNHRLIQ